MQILKLGCSWLQVTQRLWWGCRGVHVISLLYWWGQSGSEQQENIVWIRLLCCLAQESRPICKRATFCCAVKGDFLQQCLHLSVIFVPAIRCIWEFTASGSSQWPRKSALWFVQVCLNNSLGSVGVWNNKACTVWMLFTLSWHTWQVHKTTNHLNGLLNSKQCANHPQTCRYQNKLPRSGNWFLFPPAHLLQPEHHGLYSWNQARCHMSTI